MLVLFAARLLTSMFPFRIFLPDWNVRLGIELINTSPVMLTGFALLASVGILNQRARVKRQSRTALGRFFLQLALSVYLLVIPVQVVASVLVDQRFEARLADEWGVLQERLATAREAKLTPAQFQQLKQLELQLLQRRDQGSRQMRLSLVRDLVRVVVSALALVWALRLPLVVLNDRFARN